MTWEAIAFREELIALTKQAGADPHFKPGLRQAAKNWKQFAGHKLREEWEGSKPTGSLAGETASAAGWGGIIGGGFGAAAAKGDRRRAAVEGAGLGALTSAAVAPVTTALYRARPGRATHLAHLLGPDLAAGAVGARLGYKRRGKIQQLVDAATPDETPIKEAFFRGGPDAAGVDWGAAKREAKAVRKLRKLQAKAETDTGGRALARRSGAGALVGAGAGLALSGADAILNEEHPMFDDEAIPILMGAGATLGAGAGALRNRLLRRRKERLAPLYQAAHRQHAERFHKEAGADAKRNWRLAKRVTREAAGITGGMGLGYLAGAGVHEGLLRMPAYKNLPNSEKLQVLQGAGVLVGGGLATASLAKRVARAQDRRESRRKKQRLNQGVPGEQRAGQAELG